MVFLSTDYADYTDYYFRLFEKFVLSVETFDIIMQ